ncbi:hypothetical protein [Paractinoplanes lichenicola]|nr:hypothetical protein [Actinoplanes lichenicola]
MAASRRGLLRLGGAAVVLRHATAGAAGAIAVPAVARIRSG